MEVTKQDQGCHTATYKQLMAKKITFVYTVVQKWVSSSPGSPPVALQSGLDAPRSLCWSPTDDAGRRLPLEVLSLA